MFVYKSFESGLYTVGHYDVGGRWIAESEHDSTEKAAARVHHLNGGCDLAFVKDLVGLWPLSGYELEAYISAEFMPKAEAALAGERLALSPVQPAPRRRRWHA